MSPSALRPVAHPAEPRSSPVTIGIVADTHIPDRVSTLHPGVLPTFQAAGVSHILHAGDICVPSVLEELRQIAPVSAVRGNRDMFAGRLPLVEILELGGVKVALTHGHGGFLPYLWDKWQFLLFGYRLNRYLNLLERASDGAKVIVFGHTHHPEVLWRKGQMLFNPGSASFGFLRGSPPTIGLLYINPSGRVTAKIHLLEGYTIQQRQWVRHWTQSQVKDA